MARKVLSGAALPVVIGTQDEEGNWQAAGASETANAVITNTIAVAGNNEVVAAPSSGQRIVVTAFHIQNETATATTMILRAGTSTNGWRYLAQTQGADLTMIFAMGHEWRLPADTGLYLWLSGANSCNYSIAYYLENV